ncbi:MAG: DUF4301 family protein [Bacteroidota bacterium]
MLTKQDHQQLKIKGITAAAVDQQLTYFKEGFPYTKVVRAATIGDGIIRLGDEVLRRYVDQYQQQSQQLRISKFVPASGAASRMFKAIFGYVDSDDDIEQHPKAKEIVEHLEELACRSDLASALEANGKDLNHLMAQKDYRTILRALLYDEGLGYGQLPKGLLQFHRYSDTTRTPVEEHLIEAANYCADETGQSHLHFTVSPEHKEKFKALLHDKQSSYEQREGVTYNIDFSQQQPHTDTIAVDMDDQPFRMEDGSILFRPGGHGALIENLNALDADIVFIKNVDNVAPDRLKEDTFNYKKAIGGKLLELRSRIFYYLQRLDQDRYAEVLGEVEGFLREQLFLELPADYLGLSTADKAKWLQSKLNRPIRVCGMVQNEGEPGGGPFFAENPDGTVSLHIVESAQFNPNDEQQQELLKTSSHFNPVDLVCTLKDYQGNKFDLTKFVNHKQGFIAEKSKEGRKLKALELPGLWNGAMADWNTVFVEVPISTFSPVKEVNDLLRETHR